MSEPNLSPASRPVPPARKPTVRTWVLWGLWRALLIGISIAGVVTAVGWTRWLWIALLAFFALTTWAFRPDRTRAVRIPAALSEPGNHRVVLQLPGEKPVHVARALRQISGADIRTAKTMMEQAPVVVAENLSQESAAQAMHLLTSAGARATMSEMDPPPGSTPWDPSPGDPPPGSTPWDPSPGDPSPRDPSP